MSADVRRPEGGRAAWFVAGEIFAQLQGLLVFAVFARRLEAASLAAYSAALAVTWVVVVVLVLGADTGLTRYFQESTGERRRSVASTYLLLVSAASLVTLALVAGPAAQLAPRVLGSAGSAPLLVAAVALAGAQALQAVLILGLRNLGRARSFAATAAVQSVAALVLAGALLSGATDGAFALVVALLATTGIFLLPRAALVAPALGAPDVSLARELLRFGAPLLPAALLTTLASHVDRVLLLELAGPVPASRYAVAATLASTLVVLGYAFAHVFTPLALRAHFIGTPGAARARGAALFVLVALLGSAVVGLCWSAVGLLALLGGRHGGGGPMLPYLGWAFVAGASFQVTSLGLVVEKRTLAMLGLTAAAFATKLGFTFALVPRIGAIAAPMATLASQLALTLTAALSCRSTTPFAMRRVRLAVLTVGLVALSALGSHLSLEGAAAWLAGGLAGVAALGLALALGLKTELRTMLAE